MKARSAKADARREEILQAAAACFRDKGYRASSVNDICARLGISPGHLYYYFKSKAEILEAILERLCERNTIEIDALADRSDAIAVIMDGDYLIQLNRTPVEETYLDTAMLWEAFAEAARGAEISRLTARHREASQSALRRLILKARARGELRPDIDVDLFLTILEMFITGLQLSERIDSRFDIDACRRAGRSMFAPFLTKP